jgi:PAS domain S-box-containing protein
MVREAERGSKSRFGIRIVLPAILVFSLTMMSIFWVIIPAIERNMMSERRELIHELTESVWGILKDFHVKEQSGELTREEAQALAKSMIESLRYGEDKKGYYWLTDYHPTMIAHPFRSDLVNTDLSEYQDPTGKKIFVEFVELVQKNDSGFVEYLWQWKDDITRVVPKLSYVKGFDPWEWVVGTGIYLEDVKLEISQLTNRILVILLGIASAVGGGLLYSVFGSLSIEKKRRRIEKDFFESRERYQALVESSTDGVVMIQPDGRWQADQAFLEMVGQAEDACAGMEFRSLLRLSSDKELGAEWLESLFSEAAGLKQFEADLKHADGTWHDVIVVVSALEGSENRVRVLLVRDISEVKREEARTHEECREEIIAELQSTLHFLNSDIRSLMGPVVSCNMNEPVEKASQIMAQKRAGAVFVEARKGKYIGMFTDHDIRERVVAAGSSAQRPIMEIMSAPIVTIAESALVFEAVLKMHDRRIKYLAVENSMGQIKGVISSIDMLDIHGYSAASLIQSIRQAQTVQEIIYRKERLPALIKAVVDSGTRVESVVRIISAVSDEVIIKLLGFAMEEMGVAPVPFAFLALGSVGRGEQTLYTDQDNAIIYAHPEDEDAESVANYFLALGRRVCGWLDEAGYAYCKGDVMAQNPKWCQSLGMWKNYFSDWIIDAQPQDILDINIFFDFRVVYGEKEYADELRSHINAVLRNQPLFIHLLADNALSYKPPIGMFGNIVTQSHPDRKETFDIKSAILPITNIARAYAFKHGINEVNTHARIRALQHKLILTESTQREMQAIFDFLMHMRLKHQTLALSRREPVSNDIDPDLLSEIDITTLKGVLNQVSLFLGRLSSDFKGSTPYSV